MAILRVPIVFCVLIFGISDLCFGQSNWTYRNPLPQGNRLNDIHIFDTNTAIAIGSAETVMRTTNGGTSRTVQHYVADKTDNLRDLFYRC